MNTWIENSFDFPAEQECNLYYCGKRERSISHTYGPYTRNVYLLNYVKEGSALFYDQERSFRVHEGQFYVLFPQSQLCYETDANAPWSIQWLVADGALLASFLQAIHLTPQQPVMTLRFPERIETVLNQIFLKTKYGSLLDKMNCLSLMYELFALLASERELAPLNPTVGEAITYLSRNYHRPVSSAELAGLAHLSENYFIKLFKMQTKMTPQQMLDSLRIEKAKHLLKYSELSIAEIAETVGFEDPLYFSRRFRKKTGSSPSCFRKDEAV